MPTIFWDTHSVSHCRHFQESQRGKEGGQHEQRHRLHWGQTLSQTRSPRLLRRGWTSEQERLWRQDTGESNRTQCQFRVKKKKQNIFLRKWNETTFPLKFAHLLCFECGLWFYLVVAGNHGREHFHTMSGPVPHTAASDALPAGASRKTHNRVQWLLVRAASCVFRVTWWQYHMEHITVAAEMLISWSASTKVTCSFM